MNTQRNVAIVSHDAGGAEILASYVAQQKIVCRFVLEGPAITVFKRRLGAIDICSLQDGISTCDKIICGTSWQSNLEWHAIKQAQIAGRRAVAFLDHWINYPERFLRNGVQHLPDELWVGDLDTERLARNHFPNLPIRLVPNPYFIDIQQQINALASRIQSPGRKDKTVLYVSENISGHARLVYGDPLYLGYTEFDAIEYFLQNIHALPHAIDRVVIRPHPSDENGKYDYLVAKYPKIVRLSDGAPLLDEVIQADIVVGSQTTAMVVGLLAEKLVISCIPPGHSGCNLPQKQIVVFRDLVTATSAKLSKKRDSISNTPDVEEFARLREDNLSTK